MSGRDLCRVGMIVALGVLALTAGLAAQTGTITTVAGNGVEGFSGDGGLGLNASLRHPNGIVFDKVGNLYLVDTDNNRIRKISVVSGIVSTVVGSGAWGFDGDGGPATSASLVGPRVVALDRLENLYISDGNRIRRVSRDTGIITTVVGSTTFGFSGDGGPATSASLALPRGLAFDAAGNLYIADVHNHRVRKVNAATGIISTVAGNGVQGFGGDSGPATSASLDRPFDVLVAGGGHLYIADGNNFRVRKVDAATGIISTVAGNGVQAFGGDGGPATSASLETAVALTMDTRGNLFLAGPRIRRVDAVTGIITTVTGNGTFGFSGDGGPATSASISTSQGIAFDAIGNLYLADLFNQRIRRVEGLGRPPDPLPPGYIATVAGTELEIEGDGGPAVSAFVTRPVDVAIDAAGNLYIAEIERTSRIRRVDHATGIITTVAGNGTQGSSGDGGPATSASLRNPAGIAIGAGGDIYIADSGARRVRKVDRRTGIITTVAGNGTFGFSGDGGPATSASLGAPRGVALDQAGNLLIADSPNHRIRRVDATTGIITTIAGNGVAGSSGDGGPAADASLKGPGALALDRFGNLYISDSGNGRIRKVDAATNIITTVADGLMGPSGIALDRAGHLFVSEGISMVVRRIDAGTAGVTTVAGNGLEGFEGDGGPAGNASFLGPAGLALDSAGNLYIADLNNHRVRRVQGSGVRVIDTIAGDGVAAYGGDGGPGVNASLFNPYGIHLDAVGDILIGDYGNQRIRKVDEMSGVITTVAGDGNLCSPTTAACGDGGPATAASLNGPVDVGFHSNGDLFIADGDNNRIRKVDAASGIITTVAGDGNSNYSGDGGPATSASLTNPYGVSLDAVGNIYIADMNNSRIRRVDATSGIITTVAGNGAFGFSGDGGPAVSATMQNPDTLLVDAASNLYIADTANRRVRRVDAITGIISTLAGNGFPGSSGDGGPATSAGIGAPLGVARDATGNIFIADCAGSNIRRVDAATGIITTVAGDGQHGFAGDGGDPRDALLNCPARVAVDGAGGIYITDSSNHRVRLVFGLGPGVANDTTPPVISATVTGTLGLEGKYVSDVTVTWSVTDSEVPVISSSGCESTTLTSDTLGITLTCTATNRNGTASQSITLKRDATPPVLTPPGDITVGAASEAGTIVFYLVQVEENFGTFGLDCQPSGGSLFPIGVTTVQCTAFDGAGNQSNASFTITVVAAASTPVGENVAVQPVDTNGNGAPVSMMFDEVLEPGETTLSVSSVGPPVPGGFQLGDPPKYYEITTTAVFAGFITVCIDYTGTIFPDESGLRLLHYAGGAWMDVTVSLDTNANIICGRTSSLSPFTVAAPAGTDTTAPVITPTISGTLGTNGWYTSDVTVSWAVVDNESTVSTQSGCGTTTVTADTAGVTFTCTATSAGGTASQSVTIKRDATPPAISLTSPSDGATYILHAAATASYSCDDGLSGIASCAGPVASGAGIDTASVGGKTFTVNAADQAGNTASVTHNYSVRYNFSGFLRPVDNLPTINAANSGRTYPVKWFLTDANGNYITSLGSFVSLLSAPIACDASPSTIVDEEVTATGGTVLRYDATSNQFIYNWQTDKSWQGCRLLQLHLADGSYHYAKFRF